MAITNECNCNMGATDATVRRVYYKDDLDFYMTLLDCDDENIGIPDFDWRARLWTSSKMNYVTVSSVGGVKTNWRDEGDGRIHVVVDNPGLMPGDVHIDFEALLPNETFADGTRKLVKPFTAPIRLTRDCAPCPSAMEIEMMLPYVRGKALTFDDLTTEEKTEFAQQAADLVTIEDLGVASDEEVDEAMGELLDTPPTAEKKAFHLDRRIRRGIMPAKARPGIVYYNYGFIKISPYRGYGVYQLEWDLTAFGLCFEKDIELIRLFKCSESGICNTEYYSDYNVLKKEFYTYDKESHILRLNLPEEHIGYGTFLVAFGGDIGDSSATRLGFMTKTDEVMWIDRNGYLRRSDHRVSMGLEEYTQPSLSQLELMAFAHYVCGVEDKDYCRKYGLQNFMFWKKKNSGRPSSDLKVQKVKMCRQMTYHSKQLVDGPRIKMGIIKVIRKSSHRQYRSKPTVLWVFKDINTGEVHFSILN